MRSCLSDTFTSFAAVACASMVALLFASSCAHAADYSWEVAWKAPVDETFYGVGDKRNTFDPWSNKHPLPGGIAKRNGTYAWGATTYKSDIWYGINDNGGCKYAGAAGVPLPDPAKPESIAYYTYQSEHEACDWKENDKPFPRFYYYDTLTGTLHTYGQHDKRFRQDSAGVTGTRSAGTFKNIVFLAGMQMHGLKVGGDALKILAFNGDTRRYVTAGELKGYTNMRSMRVLQHPDGSRALYLGVEGKQKDFHVLRWIGTPAKPFSGNEGSRHPGFERVIDNEDNGLVSDFDVHVAPDGKRYLVAVTWLSPTHSGGLYLSEAMPAGGFSAANPGHLRAVMRLEDFDPDGYISKAWMTGSLSMYKGYAYWGTMMVVTIQTRNLFEKYPDADRSDAAQDQLVRASMERSGHVFRTSFANPQAPVTEMLYGNEFFRTYDPATDSWRMQPNKLGLKPLYGGGGLGYLTNNYTWTSYVYKDRLFLGTFDFSGVIDEYARHSAFKPPQHDFLLHKAYRYAQQTGYMPGGDLFVFEDNTNLPRALSHDGLGNPGNTGFRNFVVVDGKLYVGTSSSNNLGDRGGYSFYRIDVRD
jgi:hypothetical protein